MAQLITPCDSDVALFHRHVPHCQQEAFVGSVLEAAARRSSTAARAGACPARASPSGTPTPGASRARNLRVEPLSRFAEAVLRLPAVRGSREGGGDALPARDTSRNERERWRTVHGRPRPTVLGYHTASLCGFCRGPPRPLNFVRGPLVNTVTIARDNTLSEGASIDGEAVTLATAEIEEC